MALGDGWRPAVGSITALVETIALDPVADYIQGRSLVENSSTALAVSIVLGQVKALESAHLRLVEYSKIAQVVITALEPLAALRLDMLEPKQADSFTIANPEQVLSALITA
jgi:hypothetical protein